MLAAAAAAAAGGAACKARREGGRQVARGHPRSRAGVQQRGPALSPSVNANVGVLQYVRRVDDLSESPCPSLCPSLPVRVSVSVSVRVSLSEYLSQSLSESLSQSLSESPCPSRPVRVSVSVHVRVNLSESALRWSRRDVLPLCRNGVARVSVAVRRRQTAAAATGRTPTKGRWRCRGRRMSGPDAL